MHQVYSDLMFLFCFMGTKCVEWSSNGRKWRCRVDGEVRDDGVGGTPPVMMMMKGNRTGPNLLISLEKRVRGCDGVNQAKKSEIVGRNGRN